MAGILAIAAAMLAVSYRQLGAPFRGRSSAANRGPSPTVSRPVPRAPAATRQRSPVVAGREWLRPQLAAIVRKELRYIYRSPRTFVVYLGAFLGPAVFAVFLGSLPSTTWLSDYTLPGFCLFALWQISFLLTNTFCFDGHGVKLYFISPVRGADVLAGKNAVTAALVALQTGLVALFFHLFVLTVTLAMFAMTALAVATALLFLLATGNVLSTLFPHPVNTQKLSGQTVSGVQIFAGLIAVGVVYALVAAGPVAGHLLGSTAIAVATLVVELACAAALYSLSLSRGGRLLERRAERIVHTLTREA
jgi:hypothetical protein